MNPTTVPVDVVPLLYSGLQLDIGHRILPELQELFMRPGRKDHPEWFTEPFRRLDAARELLGVIDWPRDHPAVETDIEIDRHREALMSALDAELVGQRDSRSVEENGPEVQEEAMWAVLFIESFLADLQGSKADLCDLVQLRVGG
jgi:hypothetical protein